MEAIIFIEIEMATLRMEIHEKANTEAITKDLDMENELREATAIVWLHTSKEYQTYTTCV